MMVPPLSPASDPFGMTGANANNSGAAAALSMPLAPPHMGLGSSPSVTPSIAPLAPAFAPSLAPAPAAPAKKGIPLFAIAGIAFAGCFGIAVAIMVFMPKQAATPAQVVIMPAPTAPAATTAAAPASTDSASPPASASADTAPAGSAPVKVASNGGHGATPATSATHKSGADLSGLLGTTSGGGPNVGPGSGPGTSSGGGLDTAAVQNVVAMRKRGVTKKCWEVGNSDQKSSANVTVTVTVAPNGSVSDASATGDDPTIANCVAREVKGWTFPAPGSTTTVNIPFHFVRQ
jgi:hypothetical protein